MDHEIGREESSHELSSFDVLGKLRSFRATTTLDPSLVATSRPADAARSQPHYFSGAMQTRQHGFLFLLGLGW